MADLTAYEAQELERKVLKWQREDALHGRPYRSPEQIREEILHAHKTDRLRQIRLAREKLSDWLWAIEHDIENQTVFRAEAERRMSPLFADSPYLEWGVEFVLDEPGPDGRKIVVYPEDNQGSAERTLNEDRIASGSTEPRGRVMYRTAVGPWREAPRSY